MPTPDDAVRAKPTVAENHAAAIIVILNRDASADRPPPHATGEGAPADL